MSKLTLHCQGVPGFVGRFLERGGSTHLKGIGNYPTYPNVTTIGRVYYDQSKVDDQVRGGAVGADAIFGACWPEIQKNPQVHVWETPANEASIWLPSVSGSYVAFNQRLIQRFHDAGKKIVVGAINVGWPRLPHEDGGAMMRTIQHAARGADGLSFHEYGWEDMRQGASYYCLRYRRFHDWCTSQGLNHPPLYITECGIDRTSPPGPDFGHSGWRVVLNGNEQAYVDQLIWYEQELRKDDYVRCATIFTAGPSGWQSFDMYEGVSMRLVDALAALGPGPVPPPEPPPDPPVEGPVEVRVYDTEGNEQDQAWLVANYGRVTVSETGDYGLVELHEHRGGSSTLVVTVKDQNEAGIPGVVVIFAWPDGQVHGVTSHEGTTGFGMGGGAYYKLPGPGPHTVQAGNVSVAGLGMAWGTNHDHLDVVFVEGEPDPDPGPPPDPPPPVDQMAWGVDVSDHQGTIDWQKVAGAGCSFALIRASVCRSDGTLVPDGHFLANWNGAGAVGLRRGVYHYLGTEQRGQAAFFVGVVGDREPELGYWADLEHNGLDSGRCGEFLEAVDRNLAGRGTCNVYTRAQFLDRWGTPAWTWGRLLWVAHWTVIDTPTLPNAWDDWEFWQYSNQGVVAGIPARVDLDRYNGTVAEFHEQYGGEPYVPPEPVYYTLTALVDGEGDLEVYPESGDRLYAEGTVVSLTAFADEGWVFDRWSGDAMGSDETVSVTMDGDRSVTAHFVEQVPGRYGLGVTVEGGGVVQVVPEQPGGYEPGATVSLTAYPDEGWVFDHWSGSMTGTSPVVVITMDRDKVVTAHFVEQEPDEWGLLLEKLDRVIDLLEVIAGV